MTRWIYAYFVIFATALVFSMFLTPLFKNIAVKANLVDKPKEQQHKSHAKIVPLLGGWAMLSSWLLTLIIALITIIMFKNSFPLFAQKYIDGILLNKFKLMALMAGALFMTILGFFDDKKSMRAGRKFLWQFVIAAFVVSFTGMRITLLLNLEILSWCITVFWILLIVNAINFFDNMDGLAAGIASIAFLFFTVIAIVFKHYFVASLGTAGLGAAMGFWFFNHTPAKIFMGDCGSHFLGYTLAVTGALTTYYQEGITQTPLAILIPLFILAIPLFDMMSVIIIRIKTHKPIYIGDNNHISHRFNKMGMEKKTAVLCVHLLSIIVSLSVLPLLWGGIPTTMLCLIQACVVLLLVSILQYSLNNNQN